MILTEEEAKTKWCPMARVSVDELPECNRGDNDENPWYSRCIASACMMWVTRYDGKGFCGLAGRTS